MNICHKCKKEIAEDFFVGRQSQCPSCGVDLHCCFNCSFYDLGAYNVTTAANLRPKEC